MKVIILKHLKLTNFKGVRSLDMDFSPDITRIYGANGVGKTTIFDAFIWILFGKDSQDRKQFDIKTLDAEGRAIPKLPHEVEAVLSVDGEEITLRRTYSEKWTKKKGTVEAVFDGHVEERFYNNVPCSVKEWGEKIDAICPETLFKFITNPRYFSSQSKSTQRQMLLDMAGEVTDEAVAGTRPDFSQLLQDASGKTLSEYRKELDSTRKRINAEFEGLPVRIDEQKRDIARLQGMDFDWAEKTVATGEARVAEIDAALADKSKVDEQTAKAKSDLLEQITSLRIKGETVKRQAVEEASRDYNSRQMELVRLRTELGEITVKSKTDTKEVELLTQGRNTIIGQIEALGVEFDKVARERLTIDEKEFVCPTCGRKFEVAEIENKVAEMTRNFNEGKVARINAINAKGKELSAQRDSIGKTIETYLAEIAALGEKEAALNAEIAEKSKMPEPVDTQKIIAGNAEIKRIDGKIAELLEKIEEMDAKRLVEVDTESLKREKQNLSEAIATARETLGRKAEIARHEERVAELEKEYKDIAGKLAAIERKQYIISEFFKSKIKSVEDSINALFRHVKFRMFETQVNGAEVETCEATIDGVPYSSANNAAQITGGLDIIEAICRHAGVLAPVAIDNSESVNEFPKMDSQMILLYVSEDRILRIG